MFTASCLRRPVVRGTSSKHRLMGSIFLALARPCNFQVMKRMIAIMERRIAMAPTTTATFSSTDLVPVAVAGSMIHSSFITGNKSDDISSKSLGFVSSRRSSLKHHRCYVVERMCTNCWLDDLQTWKCFLISLLYRKY